jgi:4-alpha-glucanotransferase
MSVIVDAARERGLDPRSIACETLSTQPYPLKLVTERFGLGRFRVTQKMDVNDAWNVYRTDRAAAADWVMMSTHDTPSIWAEVQLWQQDATIGDRASYLARRLAPEHKVDSYRRAFCADPGRLVQAHFADLLVCDAENVSVFFPDLLGMAERYNIPGSVGPHNWSLRVPADYQDRYAADLARLRALNIPYACALALRSPFVARERSEGARLADRLEQTALAAGASTVK